MDYPFEISIFWLFELLVLYCLERRFFLLDYSQRHFTGLNCLEIKQWKNRQFLIKTMDEPLWKNLNCSTLWTSSLYSLQKRVLVLEYRKIPFRWNTFGKISIFFFWTSCFYSLERLFFFLEYSKTHFPRLYYLEKKRKKAYFWPKPWTDPFGNILIFRLFKPLVFIA